MDESWTYGPTGDMTLAVTSSDGRRILRVDMLASATMAAGTNGERLARAQNDLCLLAASPELRAGRRLPVLPHPDAGVSPAPWSVAWAPDRRRIRIRDGEQRLIAGYDYPAGADLEWIRNVLDTLVAGVKVVNRAIARGTFSSVTP